MIFESKFNLDEIVYYWSIKKVKILRGKITAINSYLSKRGDKNRCEYSYYVEEISIDKVNLNLSELVPEHLLFRKRDDVLDFCVALAKDI